ncbi:MAG: hypothetical protein SXV54_06460 [Chloroflexota bacterium]|nr:hypothetical protein [Chloroflexota bacterium]
MSTISIEAFMAAVEAAEQRLVSGEAKARQAKALLLQAEKARDEAAARQTEAEQQLAAIEVALRKARTLRALTGDEVIFQGEALLEQTRTEAQAEMTRLQAEAEAAQAEVEQLLATPEVQAYLDYREAQERAQQQAREQARRSLEAQLAALRPGAALGQGAKPLADLAAQAEKAGFPDLAAQARDAAEAACQVAEAQAQAEVALRKRRLIRWAERRARQAQPGDFVFVTRKIVGKDEEAGDEMGVAVHLRPLPAQSGRLRFQVITALGIENPPDEYGDVPARGRVWRWRNPPAGEPEGLTDTQAGMVAQIVRGKLRSGWAINRANGRLAHRAAEEREAARKSQITIAEDAKTVEGAEGASEVQPAVPVSQSEEHQPAELELQPSKAAATGSLEGLSSQVTARLRRVGLNTQEAVEELLATGETVFLALPGIGSATLVAVQTWLSASTQADVAEAESESQPQADDQATDGVLQSDAEAQIQPQAESVSPAEEQAEGEDKSDAEVQSQPQLQPQAGSVPLGEERVEGAGQDNAEAQSESQPQPRPPAESEPPGWEGAEVEGQDETESQSQVRPQRQFQPQAQVPDPTIIVEGDGVSGPRLAGWRGVALVGLTPVARRLGLEEIQMLVHEEEGQGQATLLVYWPGGEITISHPADGRAGQMRALREVIGQIRAQVPA